jgi:hypothetical protein
VPEQNLNDADVDAALQKVSGEAMPQNVQLTRLSSPAAAAAERQAACKTVGSIGLSGLRPGNRYSYAMLSAPLLDLLRGYWRLARPPLRSLPPLPRYR